IQASDKFNINSQLEHLQAKYVGTGHADLNRFEWAVNIQRDSYASYIGHYPLLAYFGIAENESIGRERYSFMQVIILSGHMCFFLLCFPNIVSFFVLLYSRGVLSSTLILNQVSIYIHYLFHCHLRKR
ncbi:hypothetical protein V8G54_001876, partial [Vigna mungo]